MDDLSVIDSFTDVFSRYIDSGFGLLGGEVAYLTSTLVAIDITLMGLLWAMGGHEDVFAKLIKKTLYVGTFAFILTHFNELSGIIFRSFAGLGLTASGSIVSQADFLHPGRLAAAGVDAGGPLLAQINSEAGFPEVFHNLVSITVLFLAWLLVIISFFVLAVQLFVTLIEFKLTTLAGFVLIPFALWNRTAFLAERVLGNVISSGVKVLVLAVIVGIGTTLFSQFQIPAGATTTVDQALALMLASLALFGLGIFGPGIATGLVSGAPQLGAGAAAGTMIGATGLAVAGAAAGMGATRLGLGGIASTVRTATSLTSSARAAYSAGASSTADGSSPIGAGMSQMARTAMSSVKSHLNPKSSKPKGGTGEGAPPAWASRMQRSQQISQGLGNATHVVRSADHGGSGANPSLDDDSST